MSISNLIRQLWLLLILLSCVPLWAQLTLPNQQQVSGNALSANNGVNNALVSPSSEVNLPPGSCASAELHYQNLAENILYRQRMDNFENLVRLENQNGTPRSNGAVYQIPIVVHLIESGDARTNVSDLEIQTAIAGLNEVMRKTPGIAFNNTGVDMEVEFALAVRDPHGNCTNGITRHNLSGSSAYVNMGVNFNGTTTGLDLNAMYNMARWNPTQYYNIYLVNYIGGPTGTTAGFALLAGAHGANSDGTVMLATHLKQRYSGTLIHELGHAFNLHHTFEGDGSGGTCPANDNCESDGDMVCDTPPHRRSSAYLTDCIDGVNACDGGTLSSLHAHNFMDYSSCGMQQFTPGQKVRYRQSIEMIRGSFLQENGNMSLIPPSVNEPVARFTGNAFCIDEPISLFDETPCIPSVYLQGRTVDNFSFAWTLTNGTNTYNSTDQHPIFTNLVPGTYDVQYTITTPIGTSTSNYTGAFIVQTTIAESACAPLSWNLGTYSFNIKKVKFNTIDNESHATLTESLSSYECSQSTLVQAGQSYNLEFVANTLQNVGTPVYEVLVDWNGDNQWTLANELVASGELAPMTGNQVKVVPITIPATALTNQLLRLRVGIYSEALTANQRDCYAFVTIGETEDYGIYVTDRAAAVTIVATPGTSVNSSQAVTFTATPTNGGAGPQYVWYRNGEIVSGQNGATFIVSGLANGESFFAKMYSNMPNVLSSPATSNTIVMDVYGPPVVDFTFAGNTTGCAGTTITYTDQSTFIPTSWYWEFPGGTPATSTVQNPTVVYNTIGDYTVTLRTSNQYGMDELTSTEIIHITSIAATSCTNVTRSSSNATIGIGSIKLANVESISSATDPAYVDNICTQIASLQAGQTYQMTVGTVGYNPQWYKVYLDYNGDGVFNETDELLSYTPYAYLEDTIVFTLPDIDFGNQILRMRVMTDFYTTNPAGNSCFTNFAYGQVEDIGVVIAPAPCIEPTIEASPEDATVCNGTNVTLSAAVGGNYLNYQWQSSSNGGVSFEDIANNANFSANETTLSITGADAQMNGNLYRLAISNVCGLAYTSPMTLTVNTPILSIAADGPLTFCAGESVTLIANYTSGITWSNGATTPSITVSNSGNYSFQVVNNGCTANSTPVSVNVVALPVPNAITANGSYAICQGEMITLSSGHLNGILWSNGATTSTISVAVAGNYFYTLTENGCSAQSNPVTVSVTSLPTAPITANGATTFCEGESVTLASGHTTGVLWSNGATSPNINVTTSGNYSFTVIQNGCSTTSNAVEVTVNAVPTATAIANGPTSFCEGESVTLVSGQPSGVLWLNGATTESITVSTTGNYSFTVTQNGCSATSNVIPVTVNAFPTANITASGATTFCEGGSVTLASGHTTGVLWSNGATTPSINVTTSGNYSFTVIQNGCSTTSNAVEVTVNEIPTATAIASGSTTFCEGESVTLVSGQTSGVLWLNGATTESITVSTTGNYSFTVTQNGCSATSNVITVTVNAFPTANITASGATTFCEGGSVTLASGHTSGVLWSNGATTESITVSTTGNYSFTVTQDGCSATSNVIPVTVNAFPTANITASGATTFCEGESVTLASGHTTGVLWSNGATTPSINVTTSGNYSFTVIQNGCSTTSNTVEVTVNAIPTATAIANGPTSFCEGESVTLVSGQTSGVLWSNGATTESITVSTTGNYSFTVAQNGCSATSNVIPVTVNAFPTVNITASGVTTFCEGGSVTLSSGHTTGVLWSNGATTPSINVTTSGNYSYVVTTNGCSTTSNAVAVTVNAIPTATVIASGATTFCEGESVTLVSGQTSGVLWSNGATTESITVSTTGNYSFTVTQNGCSATSNVIPVTVNAFPTANITASGLTTFCEGESVTLASGHTTGVLWSNGVTSESINVTTSGNYSYEVTSNGCSATSEDITIDVLLAASIMMEPIADMCIYNEAIELEGGLPIDGVYYLNDEVITSFDPSEGLGVYTIEYRFVNINSCISVTSVSFEVSECLNIDGTSFADILVYPNPTTNVFKITNLSDSKVQTVQIIDATGRLVQDIKVFENSLQVDCSQWATGNYTLHMIGENSVNVKSIQVIH